MSKPIWPNFYIVGAVKSGTTSLYAYLRQHPQVFLPTMKEPHFFTQPRPSPEQIHLIQYVADIESYQHLYRGADRYPRIGDASPSYLWCEEAPERIHAVQPEARIIVILRDPVQRAYAQYLMDFNEGVLDLPFMEALQKDWARPDKGWGISQLYVELGRYTAQIVCTFASSKTSKKPRWPCWKALPIFWRSTVRQWVPLTCKRPITRTGCRAGIGPAVWRAAVLAATSASIFSPTLGVSSSGGTSS